MAIGCASIKPWLLAPLVLPPIAIGTMLVMMSPLTIAMMRASMMRMSHNLVECLALLRC
jgi:ABC-type molybdate transport system permease subunit